METRLSRIGGAILGAVLLASIGCGVGQEGIGTRAVVIGIDGADWKIIDRLVAQGDLPNFARLQQEGVRGRIETLPDIPLSPVIWTSVATGKVAVKHGVSWFMVDQPDGTRAPVRSHNRKVRALWNILADRGMTGSVVGWWASYPAEDIGDGVVASDAMGFHGFGATAREGDDGLKTHPTSMHASFDALIPPTQQISAAFAQRFIHIDSDAYRREAYDPSRFVRPDPANPIHLFQMYAVTAQGYTAIAEQLLQRPDDLLMVYYEQVDSFSHLFMKYAPPQLEWVEDAEFERYRDVVDAWYRYQDELLGRLLDRIDLGTTAVFLLSDHGFKSGERRIRSEETVDVRKAHLDHETFGVFLAAGPHVRRGARMDDLSVLDLTPTVLHYLGLPVAKDMDGRVADSMFEPEFMTEHPIRYVPTYETDELQQRTPAGDTVADDQVRQQLEGLRALGYVGDDPAQVAEPGESSPEIHNNLGRIHLARGEMDRAREEFSRALSLDENNAEALLNLGSIHRAEGRTREAERLVKRAVQLDPGSIGALAQLAEIRRDQGDLPESIRLYRVALAIDDSRPFLWLGLGDSLQRSSAFAEAEAAFKTVLGLDPDSFEAHYNLGVTYLNQQRFDAARPSFEKALAVQPDHPQIARVYNNLGDLHLKTGERDRAIELFRQAVDAAPGHLEGRYNLAMMYLGDGRIDAAIPLLEQAAALQPDHEHVGVQLGMAYLHAGRNQDAYRSLLMVRRLYPSNWVAPLGLATLHAASNRPQEARPLLDEALWIGGEQARREAAGWPVLEPLLPASR